MKYKTLKKLILTLFPIIILSFGAKTESNLADNKKVIIKSKLQSIMQHMIKNYEIGNLEEAIQPFSDSPQFMSISNGKISDYKNFRIENKYYFDAVKSQKFSNSDLKYTFINNKNVIVTWSCSAIILMKNKQKIKIDPYAATFIFQKENESWKIIYAHGSGSVK